MKPKIICLCGSTKFKEAFMLQNTMATLEGHIVLAPGVFGHADGMEIPDGVKASLDELHLRKIDMADEVRVVKGKHYIGESTKREIEYAEKCGKPVELLV